METKLQILARLNHRYGQATDEFKPAAMAFDILALADYGRSDRHKEFAWDHDGDPIGLCPEGDEPPCLFCQAMREVHEMLGPIAEFFDMRVNGRYNYLDIVPAGCSKFEALRWWLEHSPSGPRVRLSRSQAESVTPAVMLFHFGDNRNDKSFGQAYLQGYRSSHLIRVSRDSGMDPQHTTTRLAIDGVIDFLEILRLMLKSRRMPPDKRQNRIIKL